MSINSYNKWAPRGLTFALLGLLAGTIVVVALMAAVPPVSRDALVHHLAVPKLYVQNGGIYEIPSIKYSYYPMNLELLYCIPLYFKNDILPKFIHFVFALLTSVLIFNYLNRRLNRNYALFGVISFLSLPVIVKLSITAYVDLGLVFLSMAALMLIFKWINSQFTLSYLLMGAVCCGLALGTKYNGLLVFFLLALFVPYAYARMNPGVKGGSGRAIVYATVFIIVALIIFAPWMIRNYMWTENPLFPLYDSIFNPESPYPSAPLGHFAVRQLVYHESWLQIALIPIRIFFQGQDANPQFFDGQLNPFLLLLPLLAFWRRPSDQPTLVLERQLLSGFAVLYILYAFFTKDMRIRYIAPALPALVLLAMFGLHNLYGLVTDHVSRMKRYVLIGLIHGAMVLMIVLNGQYIYKQFRYVAPLSYISGQVDRDAYIQKYRPEYSVFKYINTHLPPKARLLAIFMGRRSYYIDREMVFGIELLKDITKTAHSVQELWDAIGQQGFTHLIVERRLYEKWQKETFTTQERVQLNEFWRKHAALIYRQSSYELYQLRHASDP